MSITELITSPLGRRNPRIFVDQRSQKHFLLTVLGVLREDPECIFLLFFTTPVTGT